MAELVDAVDSKSTSSDRVPVQVRIRAPKLFEKLVCRLAFFVHIFVNLVEIVFFVRFFVILYK